jgi:hypothetical protein
MTYRQALFLGVWVFMGAVIIFGSSALSQNEFLALFIGASIVVSLVKDQITPRHADPPTPMQILERSRFWMGVAITYTAIIVVVVVKHLFFGQLAFFDDVSFPLLLVMLLGPGVGPIVVNQVITFRLLGAD